MLDISKGEARHNWNKDAVNFFLYMTKYVKISVNLTFKLCDG